MKLKFEQHSEDYKTLSFKKGSPVWAALEQKLLSLWGFL